jgi:murein DD-endopeptidase MepM/ murein hydrolase activator NlpD
MALAVVGCCCLYKEEKRWAKRDKSLESGSNDRFAEPEGGDIIDKNGGGIEAAVAKRNFYHSIQALAGGETCVTGEYQGYMYRKNEYGNDTEEIDTGYYRNYSNKRFGIHIGAAGKNCPVFAGIPGTVIAAGYDSSEAGYGNYVQIEYGYQFEGYACKTGIVGEYAHMKDLPLVKAGQIVSARTQLGLVGNTGKSQGEHLHYSVYTDPEVSFAENVMARIFGTGYAETAMNNLSGRKTVYDPTAFYNKYKNRY